MTYIEDTVFAFSYSSFNQSASVVPPVFLYLKALSILFYSVLAGVKVTKLHQIATAATNALKVIIRCPPTLLYYIPNPQ